eukprot:TRINITY_DN3075_c0_g2_i10.p2 TRINITY_DN3075_c0_g2~~TRINITY_DN3075_c0_g2_i10.p2  ORF type:complete len:58 (-),score=6.25 TRINITY_DN3075_c0_g2_i10:50-223(-)
MPDIIQNPLFIKKIATIIFLKRKKRQGNKSHRKAANSGNSVSKISKECIVSNKPDRT